MLNQTSLSPIMETHSTGEYLQADYTIDKLFMLIVKFFSNFPWLVATSEFVYIMVKLISLSLQAVC